MRMYCGTTRTNNLNHKRGIRSSLNTSNIIKVAKPKETQSRTSTPFSLLKENNLLSAGKKSTVASIATAPLVTHHKAALGDCSVASADLDQERLVKIRPMLANTSVVKVSVLASSAPIPL